MNEDFLAALALCLMSVNAQAFERYSSEREALAYCNGGGVVWLDVQANAYVYRGSPHYGKSKDGAYVCEVDAINAGFKPLQSHRQ